MFHPFVNFFFFFLIKHPVDCSLPRKFGQMKSLSQKALNAQGIREFTGHARAAAENDPRHMMHPGENAEILLRI